MKTKSIKLLLLLLCFAPMFCWYCSYSTGYLDYRKYHIHSSDIIGHFKYVEIMPIRVTKTGFIWESCDEIVYEVATEMYDLAKTRGGNALMNVQWYGQSGLVTTPTCRRMYGWFALYIVPGLAPWVQRASAEGVMIRILDTSSLKGKGKSIIPLGNRKEFIDRFTMLLSCQ